MNPQRKPNTEPNFMTSFPPVTGVELSRKIKATAPLLGQETLGRLKRELFWTVGPARTLGIMARLGLSCGKADAINSSAKTSLISGLADITNICSDPKQNKYSIDVAKSVEALEYKKFYAEKADIAQCWILAGYFSGYIGGITGQPLFFLETQCIARRDPFCRFVGKLASEWNADDQEKLRYYDPDRLKDELKTVYDQLHSTRDRYQNLFEESIVPIFIVQPQSGSYVDCNRAAEELTGFPRNEILRMTVFDLRPSNQHHQVAENLKTIVAGGEASDQESSIIREDGSVRIVAQTSKVINFGGQRALQCVMRDISDLKQAEQNEKDLQERLLRSERLSSIGRLAAGVAHELKNPLGAIRNAIYYIKDSLKESPLLNSDPHLKEIIKLAETEVDGSVTIIGELLDFSRVIQLAPRETDINALLQQILSIVEIPKNIEVQWDLEGNLDAARVDPERLKQVFCNIINNGVQSMPNGGTLTLKSRFESEPPSPNAPPVGRFIIIVEDTGVGIAPWHLSKIFEPLFTTKAKGTGLGLAISHNIVEKHGGIIHVTSQLGKGTSFTIELPLRPPSDKEENDEQSKDSAGR